MVRDIGPVIAPGPSGDEYRRSQEKMEELKIAQARRSRFKQLLADAALPGSPERRELELTIEKYRSDIEKYAGSRKQNLAAWQKGTGEVIQDILKMADNAAALYEPYPEYPFNVNFNDYEEDKEKAAKRRESRMWLINQAVALYFLRNIQELNQLNITDKPEFREMQHYVNMLKAKMGERADLDRAATEFERQAGLAEFQIAHSQERDRDSATHSASIQSLSDTIGIERKHYLWRLLRAGEVKKYSEQGDERVKELAGILAHVERHRRETEVKIASYISQAKKRNNAVDDYLARIDSLDEMVEESRATINLDRIRTIRDEEKAMMYPIGDRRYMTLADRIIEFDVTSEVLEATNADIREKVMEARTIAIKSKSRVEEARDRFKAARVRAEEARMRAEEAKAYNDNGISDELAKNAEKCAKNVEELEKKVVESASLSQFNMEKIREELDNIYGYIAIMQQEANRIDIDPADKAKKLTELANKVEKAEMAKNSAIAFGAQVAKVEEELSNNIRDKLQEEYKALIGEHPNAERIRNLASVTNHDITTLQNLVGHQKALEEALRGVSAEGGLGRYGHPYTYQISASSVDPSDSPNTYQISASSVDPSDSDSHGSVSSDRSSDVPIISQDGISPDDSHGRGNRYQRGRFPVESSGRLNPLSKAFEDDSSNPSQETHDSWSDWERLSAEPSGWENTLGSEPEEIIIRGYQGTDGSGLGRQGTDGSGSGSEDAPDRHGRVYPPPSEYSEFPDSLNSSPMNYHHYWPAVAAGLIQREREQSQAARNIHDAILNRQDTGIGALKDAEAACRAKVLACRANFMKQLRNVRDAERAAAEALKRNAIHMGRDITSDANQAIERLQKIKDDLTDLDDDGLKKRSKGHIFIDPKAGKFTINGVWMNVREVHRWDFAVPDQTTVEYRPDIVKVEVETVTREAKGGKLSVDPIYTKRLSERYFRSADFEFMLKIPGQSYTHGGRTLGEMTVIDLKKKDGKIKKEVPWQAASAKALAEEFVAGIMVSDKALGRNEGEKAVDAVRRSVKEANERLADATAAWNAATRTSSLDEAVLQATLTAANAAIIRARENIEDLAITTEIITEAGDAAQTAVLVAGGAVEAATKVLEVGHAGAPNGGAGAPVDSVANAIRAAIDALGPLGTINAINADNAAKIFSNSVMWTEDEYRAVKTFDMRAASKIKIKENHNNQTYPVEVLFDVVTETMPDAVIDHRAVLATKRWPAWSDEEKRRMCKLDLDRQALILPNGQEYRMKDFDWTETKWDEDNGLTLQFKGPKELSQLNLIATGSSDTFNENLSNATAALKKKKRKQAETGIELIKQVIKSYNVEEINAVIGAIQSSEGIVAHESNMTKIEMIRPPKNALDLDRLRRKKKAQRDVLTPKWVTHAIQSTTGMFETRQGYENEVEKRIRTIHKDNPLSAKRVWRSRANPERYALVKHKSSKKKQELLDEISAAEHLDKTMSFPLLENPKQGPASVIKNAKPNGLELLREYNLYVDKQDFANEIEQQNVEHYVASIATEFKTNPNISPYYTNQWNLGQAMRAVHDNNFLSEEDVEHGTHIVGVIECIRRLKQVDRPPISDKSLASLRQDDEYHWVTFLRDALTEADKEGMAELLRRDLFVANERRESNYSHFLKFAERALDLETSSEQVEKILDDMQTPRTPMPWPEVDQKPTVSKDQKPDSKFDPKAITKKSDGELALEAGKSAEQIYKSAVDAIDNLIESTTDFALQGRYRAEAVKMAMELAKQSFQIHKQDKEIQNQWQKLEVYIKEVNTQRWKDFYFTLAIFAFQQGPRTGADGVKKFMDEILKIVGKSIT
ncbi:MAG TPA: hypothetical protein VGL94_15700 [Ktedonobacteraceae bacterium]